MTEYDIIVVGAGVAGSSIAHALSTLSPRPKVALLERSLATPSRIVGELLQPTGVHSLQKLGLDHTLEGIHAAKAIGYYVWDGARRTSVHIPYPGSNEGRSFHHGSFIDALRNAVNRDLVDVIECSVSELIYENGRVVGVTAKQGSEKTIVTYRAALTIVADGCFSIFRSQLLAPTITTKSHFVGTVLKDATLPMKYHGHVGLIPKGHGPVLLYQIKDTEKSTETRLLVDVKAPLPRDLKGHITTNIVPHLPESLHAPILASLDSTDPEHRIRTMPNSFLPPSPQSNTLPPGAFLLGDAYNMRHPLTGGGMSVAFNDVVILRDLFVANPRAWSNDKTLKRVLHEWYWARKPLSATINILSVALYDLFGADDRNLAILRNGCFKYFELGGECVNGPVSMLAGIAPSPFLLFRHFFAVAFYSIIVLFTRSNPPALYGSKDTVERHARITEYPSLAIRGFIVFITAVQVFGPLLWTELRWWNPFPKPSLPSPKIGTSTTRGAKQHDENYSETYGMRFMILACLASAVTYYQVIGPANSSLTAGDVLAGAGATSGFTLSALKSNMNEGLGNLWGAAFER